MNAALLVALKPRWDRCRTFVAATCAGRPVTHGLAHMEQVTQSALLIAALNGQTTTAFLNDVVLVGMLHDVADHKYDLDGALFPKVQAFLEREARDGFMPHDTINNKNGEPTSPASGAVSADEAQFEAAAVGAHGAIESVSFSKEKKKGMRYFEAELEQHWVQVRDVVSDADKLLAIGDDGLFRCRDFTLEMYHGACERVREKHSLTGVPRAAAVEANASLNATVAGVSAEKIAAFESDLPPVPTARSVADRVQEHADEKLLLLVDDFIVTPGGKWFGAPKQQEMVDTLALWRAEAPPLPATFTL